MRISGPLLDRIDLYVEVPRLSPQDLMAKSIGESSAVREQVERGRGGNWSDCNLQRPEDGARDLLKNAINQLGLSARAYDRILKVARTIADLDGADTIELHHIVGSSRVDLQACKLEYSIVSPK